jgi:hypothetical protein
MTPTNNEDTMLKRSRLVYALLACGFTAALMTTACSRPASNPEAKTETAATPMVQNAAPDLDTRLARWKRIDMPFDMSQLSPKEQQMVQKLIDACRQIENMYWRQSDPVGMKLWQDLAGATDATDKKVRRLLWINGSRWDLLDENHPFVGSEPMPPGHALYPARVTQDDIDTYLQAHPDQKDAIYGDRTMVVRGEDGALQAIPYHEAFKKFLEPAAQDLRDAADLSDDEAFANYLRLRADALLTDDYFKSDVAWVELENPKFDLIFAPYETYLDNLLGVKTSYGAAVLVRNEGESAKLAVFQKYVPAIQEALPLPAADLPSKEGKRAPMEVMDAPFRAGDLRHGYQAVADNLPNDPRIHEQYGSKRIFFKNFLDARVKVVILPLAQRLMQTDQADLVTADGFLTVVMMHEISHGLGPAFSRIDGKQVDTREAIGGTYSGLEEAKADVTGMFGLKWLVDHGALPAERLNEYYASYVGSLFRTVRFGTGEAHGRAVMMEFNFLSEKGAIQRGEDGRYTVDFDAMPGAIADLTKTLLTFEAKGDRAGVEAWLGKYGEMPDPLKQALDGTTDIPVDLDPVVPFKEGVE